MRYSMKKLTKQKLIDQIIEINKEQQEFRQTPANINSVGSRKSIVEFLQEEPEPKKSQVSTQYYSKNQKQLKTINQAFDNFISIMSNKMSTSELTFVRFKAIVENSVKMMHDKIKQNNELLKILVVMEKTQLAGGSIYEDNIKILDDNFSYNEKEMSTIFEISLKLSQMKNITNENNDNPNEELNQLNLNLDQYLK